MDAYLPTAGTGTAFGGILQLNLDCQPKGDKYYYIWRYNTTQMAGASAGTNLVMLDMKHLFLPEDETDKMLYMLCLLSKQKHRIAFLHCPTANQGQIKRKLKAMDLQLYSNTSFFADRQKAEQWLRKHAVSC